MYNITIISLDIKMMSFDNKITCASYLVNLLIIYNYNNINNYTEYYNIHIYSIYKMYMSSDF